MERTKTGSITKNNNASAVYNHFLPLVTPLPPSLPLAFSLDDLDIISQANNIDLLIHESLFILKNGCILNSQMSSFPLTLF